MVRTHTWLLSRKLESLFRQAKKLLNEDERQELIYFLSAHPHAGVLIEGTGGIRKLRWGRSGIGKSGGVRVIYFFRDKNMPLYLLTVYGKGDKASLSARERKDLASLAEYLVAYWRNRWS